MIEIIQSGLTEQYLQKVANDILQEAKKQGASDAEADVVASKGFSVTVRKGDVESVEYNQGKLMNVVVYFGQRLGAASLSDLRPEAIQSAVQAACNIARFTDADEYAGLAEKNLLAFNYPQLDLAFPWDITVEQAIEMAKACEAQALQQDKRITNSEGVTISTDQTWHIYGNTHDFVGSLPTTTHEMSCSLIATQGTEMQRDHYYTVACDPESLESSTKVAHQAAARAVNRLGAQRLSTCRVPVIFIAEEARSLLGHFISAISGSNLYRKSSFLLDHLSKPVFPAHITLDERPHLAKGMGSTPFDNDGVATRPNVFVKDGILTSYSLGVYAARKLGLQTTGNAGGVHNLFINTSQKDLPALLKSMGTGLLITELMGQGINMVTGDYSRGATGFWIERGEIQYPVEEITIAGNLRDMFLRLVEVGCDVDKRGGIQTGSILLDDMVIAGN